MSSSALGSSAGSRTDSETGSDPVSDTGAGPQVVEVEDSADPRLSDYRGLTDVALRKRAEPEAGLFIAEGQLVISRALATGFQLRSALMTRRWLDTMAPMLPDGLPVYIGSEPVLQGLTGFHVHRGALASVHRRALRTPAEVLAGASRVAVLEDVNTHTNVGSIFRAAAGLGIEAVLLTPSCADPLYRRAVRVSMGAVFSLPYARLESWPGDLSLLAAEGFRLLALTPAEGATDLADVHPGRGDRIALILGAEGPGLTAATLAAAEPVRIPMGGGMDSLNVAGAAAVAFWALGQRR